MQNKPRDNNWWFIGVCLPSDTYFAVLLTDRPTLISPPSLDGSDRQVTLKVLIILSRVTLGLYQLWTLGSSICINAQLGPRVLRIKAKTNEPKILERISTKLPYLCFPLHLNTFFCSKDDFNQLKFKELLHWAMFRVACSLFFDIARQVRFSMIMV